MPTVYRKFSACDTYFELGTSSPTGPKYLLSHYIHTTLDYTLDDSTNPHLRCLFRLSHEHGVSGRLQGQAIPSRHR